MGWGSHNSKSHSTYSTSHTVLFNIVAYIPFITWAFSWLKLRSLLVITPLLYLSVVTVWSLRPYSQTLCVMFYLINYRGVASTIGTLIAIIPLSLDKKMKVFLFFLKKVTRAEQIQIRIHCFRKRFPGKFGWNSPKWREICCRILWQKGKLVYSKKIEIFRQKSIPVVVLELLRSNNFNTNSQPKSHNHQGVESFSLSLSLL